MGACASVPKAMRGEDGGAPPPEIPNEETTTTEVPEVQAAEKEVTVEGRENKAEDGNDNVKQEDEKNKLDGDHKSLGSLLENEEVKELPKTVKISSETEIVAEEQNSEALPVSDKAEGEPAEKVAAAYVAPVARATEEEKEAEKK